ncbi:MAG TPA: carboxylate--amine ligase [Deltaproteobacteria bacterium]|nr:carboxylate--amine ligase [Deltaproteobacteria bacterium]HPL87857.1 carboxylate--amine ligase [Deltaproteobacteria bacterium]
MIRPSNKAAESALPLAVVLHIAYTGYGVVRSLTAAGIPVVAFQKDTTPPEARSELPKQLITFAGDEDLLEKLTDLAQGCREKPVLFITSDVYVEFFIRHREVLEELFRIHYPPTDIVNLLLNKDTFMDYALRRNLPLPVSFRIASRDDLEQSLGDMVFPAIVKPFTKTPAWLAAKLAKAYLVKGPAELVSLYRRIEKIEPGLLVQEWVPGPDSHVEYCLTYFDQDSRCLASFTGAKIRQWPVGTGSTASTRPVNNELIRVITVALFSAMGYRGFGSVEYKRHEKTGKYYIMEPTVGRPNQQSYIATANGVNMPLIAYNSLTGLSVGRPFTDVSEPVYYIDEWADIGSVLVHLMRGQNCLGDFLGLLGKKKAFRYADRRDMQVFISSCMKLAEFGWSKLARRNGKG